MWADNTGRRKPGGYRAMAHAMAEADLRDVLPRIAVPVLLLLHGELDERSPLKVADELHEQVPVVAARRDQGSRSLGERGGTRGVQRPRADVHPVGDSTTTLRAPPASSLLRAPCAEASEASCAWPSAPPRDVAVGVPLRIIARTTGDLLPRHVGRPRRRPAGGRHRAHRRGLRRSSPKAG